MINILSYVGMNMHSELCLWTLLGLMRTIFDATLFKVNANLKQVWQMTMPVEISLPVQRMLRTMISGIMLVQCFTVYVYLASYIVLLFPVFLEERPTLVLPWLLLAAIRRLLCELTSLALGLGTCLLVGPAKPPCVKFLIFKILSIMPAFYMWMLVYTYYHALKVATAFKTFPVVLPEIDRDYGFELAVRRRCTKSLFGEEQLRKKLVAGFYTEGCINSTVTTQPKVEVIIPPREEPRLGSDAEDTQSVSLQRLSTASNKNADGGSYEDWFGSEIILPRGDRILEQFAVMSLRLGAYLQKDTTESLKSQMFNSAINATWGQREHSIQAMTGDVAETPSHVGNSKSHTASYLREYPQIFMKGQSLETPQTDRIVSQIKDSDRIAMNDSFQSHSSKSVKSTRANESKPVDNNKAIRILGEKMAQSSKNIMAVPPERPKDVQESDGFSQEPSLSKRELYMQSKKSDAIKVFLSDKKETNVIEKAAEKQSYELLSRDNSSTQIPVVSKELEMPILSEKQGSKTKLKDTNESCDYQGSSKLKEKANVDEMTIRGSQYSIITKELSEEDRGSNVIEVKNHETKADASNETSSISLKSTDHK